MELNKVNALIQDRALFEHIESLQTIQLNLEIITNHCRSQCDEKTIKELTRIRELLSNSRINFANSVDWQAV